MVLTNRYRITGDIALMKGARLTDYVNEARAFIALTNVEVVGPSGETVLRASFLNLQRASIECVTPMENVLAEDRAGEGERRDG